jgi:Cu/Ag efflux pump CusA
MPILRNGGTGSEIMQRIAVPMIGGIGRRPPEAVTGIAPL